MDTLEFFQGALTVGSGVGGAIAAIGVGIGLAKAAWRAGGQWGIDYDYRKAALDAQVEMERARATVAGAAAAAYPRSYSLHYAPHVHTAASWPSDTLGAGAAGGSKMSLPGITDLGDLGFYPTLQRILLALGPEGNLVTVPAKDLMHVALLAATGGGKSNTIRLLASQLLAIGSDVAILDPHFTPYDAETGEDWRAIARRAVIASDAGSIEEQLRRAIDLLDERLALRRAGDKVGPPVTFVVDELPIIANLKGAMERITRILREGRKVGVFFVGASQDLLVKTLGGGGAIRDNLKTAYYGGGDPHSASVLLDLPRREINEHEGTLGQGVVLLRSAATAAMPARVPYVSNRAIHALLGDGGEEMLDLSETDNETQETVSRASEKGETVSHVHQFEGAIQRLRAQGHGKKAVIELLWGTKPGGSPSYQRASAIYDQVVRGRE
jgi:hypothetical protein